MSGNVTKKKQKAEANGLTTHEKTGILKAGSKNKQEVPMKKNFIRFSSLLLVLALCLPLLLLVGCGGEKEEKTSRMTVDINPSVEFILDKDNKVVSVTALNDDGAVIISGEAFVGKTAEEAAQLVVQISTDKGYLVKGEAQLSNRSVKIQITGDKDVAEDLYKNVKKKVEDFSKEHGLDLVAEKVEALNHEALATLAAHCTAGLTKEEAMKKTDEELLALLRASREETKELLSAEMRENYYKMKEAKLELAKNEAILAAIDNGNAAYSQVLASYRDALALLRRAIEKVEEARYTYLISKDSDYQKALAAFMDAKANYNQQKKEVSEMTEGAAKTAAEATLKIQKIALDGFEATLNSSYRTANSAIDLVVETLKQAEKKLSDLEKEFPEEIKTILENQVKTIDDKVNTAKDAFFEEFEKKYKSSIESYKNSVSGSNAQA